MLTNPVVNPPPYLMEFPICEAMLAGTMSATRARHAAEQADRSAYDDAVSSYADLGRDQLRAAAPAALQARDPHA